MSFYVHDEFPDHRKWEALWAKSADLWARCNALWLVAGCYSKRAKTDGHVSRERLLRLTPYPPDQVTAIANALVGAGFWELEEEGYRFHDWADVQETAAEAQQRRERNRVQKREKRAQHKPVRAPSARRPRAVRADGAADRVADKAGTARGQAEESARRLGEERRGEDLFTESSEDGDPGRRAQRQFLESELTNIATKHDYEAWKTDWVWIGLRPAEERAQVIGTLIGLDWPRRNWRRCNPGHLRRHWQIYLAGEEPVWNGASSGSRGRAGPSEVCSPEEFRKEQEETP